MRHDKVDSRRLNVGKRTDRVLKLTLKRALVVDLFVELRAHPVRLIEYLKAKTPAFDASFGSAGETRLVQLRGRHANHPTIGRDVKGYLSLIEGLRDLARIFRVEIGIERPPVGAHINEKQTAEKH